MPAFRLPYGVDTPPPDPADEPDDPDPEPPLDPNQPYGPARWLRIEWTR